MTHQISTVAAFAAASVLACASAAAAPVLIDSEQKANAALYTATRVMNQTKNDFDSVTHYARGMAESALLRLAASTTPAAVMSSPHGVTLACATSGNITARMARSFPRVLKLQWQACRFQDVDSFPHERNGLAEVVLLSDTFSPQKVAAIRFGNLSSDFTDSRHIEYPDQITDEKRSLNLRMLGQIPMARAFPLFGLFIGEFAFELTGFYQIESRTELPGTGQPVYEQTFRLSPEFVIASGVKKYPIPYTQLVEDLRLHWGTVTTYTANPPPYGETTSSYSVEGLRIRDEFDYNSFSIQQSLDGKVDYQYIPAQGASTGCQSGLYTFKTRAPLARSLNAPLYSSGDLLINGSTTAQFYTAANVPPTLPVPLLGNLIHLDVRDVGSFNYDTDNMLPVILNGQCNL